MDLLKTGEFADHVEALMLENRVPGVSVAVVHGDSPPETKSFGYASVEKKRLCTSKTLFDVASCAKSLTAAAVALLVQDDECYPHIQYATRMASLLPGDFVMSSAQHTNGVTVEDILSHRTGMAGHDNSYMGTNAAEPDTPLSITRNLRNLAVAAPLRSRYLYCNMMYTVAALMVERECGVAFSKFLEDRIFQPLRMNHTALQPSRAVDRGFQELLSQGHCWDTATKSYSEFDIPDCPEGQGAGSIISSADDFIKWIRALMNHTFPISKLIYTDLVKMRSIVNPNARRLRAHTSPAIYAAGMEVYYYRGYKVIGHDGNTPGSGGRFVFLPELRLGIVVMGNSSGIGAASTTIVRVLIDDALGVPLPERQLRKVSKGKKKSKRAAAQASLSTSPDQPTYSRDTADPSVLNPQISSLNSCTGTFHNLGYGQITITLQHCQLFVDARDRSMGFTLEFEKRQDDCYTAHLIDSVDGEREQIDVEFVFRNEKLMRLGLDLEPAVRELIWFDRCSV